MKNAELPELLDLERLIAASPPEVEARTACEVRVQNVRFPVHVLCVGSTQPSAPAIGFFGGVHGLERVGTHVVLAFLHNLIARLRWDRVLRQQLRSVRLVFMPLVNPGGMWLRTRSNPAHVDLMRNSPIEARPRGAFLLGGHRLSPRLPWYRGRPDLPMEPESEALCRVVREELLSHRFSIALDCHSGFGMRDRIWFPYAHTAEPFAHHAEMQALRMLFELTYPNHAYLFEPQSGQYLAHGDLWDHLSLEATGNAKGLFLPLTLEMGSWLWVKKNPRQLLSRLGIFNPLPEHRRQRVLRRHLVWLDFLLRAAASHRLWLPSSPVATPPGPATFGNRAS